MARKSRKQPTPVRASLRDDSELRPQVQDGLQGLNTGDIDYLEGSLRQEFADSLNLDMALSGEFPNEPRWDYLVGHRPSCKVVGVEVHPAGGQVSDVIEKKRAACHQLGPHLRDGHGVALWLWVASGSVGFLDMERVRRRLDQAGITFAGSRILAKHVP